MLGGAEVGPADVVADVLQLVVEVDVEQRDLAAPAAVVVARAQFVGLGLLRLQAGGGIVADSVPALEWEETINKRRAMFRAVALAEQSVE
ncbi:hypothetical protein OUHCRE3_58240 [Enterobacter hormaechei]